MPVDLPGPEAPADEWLGRSLGGRTAARSDRDPILFALAVGAPADRLDLVFEDRLRVLPTFALTLAQWAPDVLGGAGAFDVTTALHGGQVLEVRAPLPVAGELAMAASVTAVWDKGSAPVYDVTVESDCFVATWSLFAPARGGFGGDRGPGRPQAPAEPATRHTQWSIAANAALLYRLLGDRHHIHVDPAAAAAIGQDRPILHGLATLSTALLPLADAVGAHPADLRRLEGRFAAPVLPGETIEVRSWDSGAFEIDSPRGAAVTGGVALFA